MTNFLDTLTPVTPPRGQAGFKYFTSPEGHLFGGRKDKVPHLIAYKGAWEGTRRAQDPAPTTTLQDRFPPRPEPTPTEEEEEGPKKPTKRARRFAFTFPLELAGIVGTVTIEEDTLKEVRDSIEEVKIAATKFPHLGIKVGVTAGGKVEDEYVAVLEDGTRFCRRHLEPMGLRNKQGDTWYSHNVGTEANPCWCRGRPGSDSPGWLK